MMKLIFIADSIAAKGTNYSIGYQVGAWLPFVAFAIIATWIILKKKKS